MIHISKQKMQLIKTTRYFENERNGNSSNLELLFFLFVASWVLLEIIESFKDSIWLSRSDTNHNHIRQKHKHHSRLTVLFSLVPTYTLAKPIHSHLQIINLYMFTLFEFVYVDTKSQFTEKKYLSCHQIRFIQFF